jgi:hypothetical protein
VICPFETYKIKTKTTFEKDEKKHQGDQMFLQKKSPTVFKKSPRHYPIHILFNLMHNFFCKKWAKNFAGLLTHFQKLSEV